MRSLQEEARVNFRRPHSSYGRGKVLFDKAERSLLHRRERFDKVIQREVNRTERHDEGAMFSSGTSDRWVKW